MVVRLFFSSIVGSITEDGNKDLLVLDAAWIPAMNVNVIRIINDIEFDVTPDWFSPPKLICSKCSNKSMDSCQCQHCRKCGASLKNAKTVK